MPERTATIASTSGLHARPANLFVQAVQRAGLPVQIARAGQPGVDARSILSVMGLGAKHGEQVVLSTDADDSQGALEDLVTLLETDLDAAESTDR
ncbi:HPr family phosphocarrier protein [Ruania zhangjianzhongii]|uniref:HPr family phosphocarrier protein n=1 Tax=Ruania zhangjianzhongii TaxID=2603206 RepID=UPI0011CC865A|nr:HPr family phosphocarrier protein [Ruania zhangjianzhongii]